ncbi:MAG: hypothetical protein RBR53_03395 [Desulforegulaceae bacterium]|nr:hypothetical protein [Desulforegulaceae bacterium]
MTVFFISKINPTSIGVLSDLKKAQLNSVFFEDFKKYISDKEADFDNVFFVPTTDQDNIFILENYDKLSELGHKFITSKKTLSIALDKYLFYKDLSSKNILTPTTWLLDKKFILKKDLFFPLILKPCFPGEWKTAEMSAFMENRKAVFIKNILELKHWYNKLETFNSKIIVQEIIEQKNDENYSFCGYSDENGKVLWGFLTQKLIQYPEGFGTGVMCTTVDNLFLYSKLQKIVEEIGVEGIFELEVIRSKKDDKLYVIELNPRHWGQHSISTKLGVNITLLDYYYKRGDFKKVKKIIENRNKDIKKIVWIDTQGYLNHCIKNLFLPSRCKFKEFFSSKTKISGLLFDDFKLYLKLNKKKLVK